MGGFTGSIAGLDCGEVETFSSLQEIETKVLGPLAYGLVTVRTTFLLRQISARQTVYA
jgi:hypothetical protein